MNWKKLMAAALVAMASMGSAALAAQVCIPIPDQKVPRLRELCAYYAAQHGVADAFSDVDCALAMVTLGLTQINREQRLHDAAVAARAARRAAEAAAETEFQQNYRVRVCGDGIVDEPEACDDGNHEMGDGCYPDCTLEQGWACTGAPSVCTHGGGQ